MNDKDLQGVFDEAELNIKVLKNPKVTESEYFDALCAIYDLVVLLNNEKEYENAYKLAEYIRPKIKKLCEYTSGMSFTELCDVVISEPTFSDKRFELYWQVVLEESFYNFESFVWFMERKRPFEKKFYEPRAYTKSGKKALKLVVEELQKLEFRVYRKLAISMPPRVGKLIADYTPVLTKDGWKTHGELKVGDYVIGLHGEWVKVTYVHPKNFANKRVTFSDGNYIDCHENHEWVVYDKQLWAADYIVVETKCIERLLAQGHILELIHDASFNEITGKRFCNITDIEPVSGNCITVEGGIYRVGKSFIPTHNSTIFIFNLIWKSLRAPNSHNAYGGYSGVLAKGFYKEIMNLVTSSEYCYEEIYRRFHPADTFICDKSAEDLTLTLADPSRFATITCRGIDGSWTGIIDVSNDGLLAVDDLVRDREESMSPQRMEKIFQEYLNKMVDRMNTNSQECLIGTLWGVLDPIERLRLMYEGNPLYKFLRIPALDENDESNFDYLVNGFTTEYYREMRTRLDKAEWMAKFQQQPFVREGLLFPAEELRFFDGIVIKSEIKRVFAVTDPSFGGGDNLSTPICYELNNGRKLICGWIYDKRTVAYTIPRVVKAMYEHDITEMRIEKNGAGLLLEKNIRDEMAKQNVHCCKLVSVSAPNRMSKEDKIKGYSDYIKMNFEFLLPNTVNPENLSDDVLYFQRNADYQNAMDEMSFYTSEGRNIHDDAPDSMAQLAIMCENTTKAQVKVIHNPFGGGMYDVW